MSNITVKKSLRSYVDPKEKEIERMVLDFLAYKRLFVWKNPSAGYFDPNRKMFRRHSSPYAINGAPDVICVKNGRFIGLEIKTRLGRLSDSQRQFKERLEASGGLYFVVRSVEDAETVYKAIASI
jgi:hypothetical protein